MKPKFLIPFITLILLFIPMLIMSISMDAFWIDSKYDEPFVLHPAFLIGDSLLLPVLNYHIYLALKKVIHFLKKNKLYKTVFYSFIVSVLLNSYTHYLWSNAAPGILNPQPGTMSLAGWWHYVVSSLQFTVVFSFVGIWVLSVRQQSLAAFKAFEKALYILMVFNLVNLSGLFINKDLVLCGSFTPDLSFISILNAINPLIIAVAVLFCMRWMFRSANFE